MAKIKQINTEPFWSQSSETKVTIMGNITELLTLQKKSNGCITKKLDKDHYYNTETGEISEYKHITSRADSLDSVRHTLALIRALINTNVTVAANCLWVTLTYAENMTDNKRLYRDFSAFWKRFKRYCEKQNYSIPEYITVQEPQGRGAWHVHGFFIWQEKAPFIANDIIAGLWRQGFTKTKSVKDTDNLGAYFSAYLADVPLDDASCFSALELQYLKNTVVQEKEVIEDDGSTKTKKFIKGGRLCLYPPSMNIVRRTKGIKPPSVEYMTREEAEKKVCAATQTFSRQYEVLADDGSLINAISKAYYNSKR